MNPVTLSVINPLASASDVTSSKINSWGGVNYSLGASGLSISFPTQLLGDGIWFMNTGNNTLVGGCAVAMDVTNPTNSDEYIYPGIYDNSNQGMTCPFLIHANSTETVAMVYGSAGGSTNFGMQALPNPLRSMVVNRVPLPPTMSLSNVRYIAIYPQVAASTIIIKNIRVIQDYSNQTLLTNSVDKYGQTTLLNFTNQLTSDSDFATRLSNEQATLNSEGPLLTNVDQYGGQLSLPAQTATGHFYTTQYGGKWWFVTPLGHLMYESGIGDVSIGAVTETANRSFMFNSLPASTDPTSAAYVPNYPSAGDTSFDFYRANLIRKYGQNYVPAWQQMAVQRFQNWGFNSTAWIPGWMTLNTNMPYIFGLTTGPNVNHIWVLNGFMPVPDPFDPNFTNMLAVNKIWLQHAESDPNCIGVWIDNEIGWYGMYNDPNTSIGISVLQQNTSYSGAKQELLAELQRRYGTIASLNLAWGTLFTSWTAMNTPVYLPWVLNGPETRDLRYFEYILASKYYSTVRQYVKSVAPDVLYMGSKMDYWTPESLLAAKNNVDVISWDYYGTQLPAAQLSQVESTGKPCIISEFSLASQQNGFYSTLSSKTLSTDADRANGYLNFAHALADLPCFVGLNFYKYLDNPCSGVAGSGENFNWGFVDITDTPYQSMVDAARTVNANNVSWHLNGN